MKETLATVLEAPPTGMAIQNFSQVTSNINMKPQRVHPHNKPVAVARERNSTVYVQHPSPPPPEL
jgi:hypothetical protein